MDFNDYQKRAMALAVYPGRITVDGLVYTVLGLAGEAGELANTMKKCLRDDAGRMEIDRQETMIKELGDVLWYCAAVATELGIGLDLVAQMNLDKLSDRQDRGTLQGSGDVR